jgi:hypothetical protein
MAKSPKVPFKRKFWRWRRRNFNYVLPYPRANWGDWVIKPDRVDYVTGVMNKYATIVKRDDVLTELPPLAIVRRSLPLSPKGRKFYRAMSREYLAACEETGITSYAGSAGVRSLRLTELASGMLRGESGATCVDNWKYADAAELCAELADEGRKAIVWMSFKPQYEFMQRALRGVGVAYAVAVGGQSSADRERSLRAFEGDTSVLLAHPAAVGTGMNLQHASAMLYISRTYHLEWFLQSQARAYRKGSEQHDSVAQYRYISENTIDEQIDAALDSKWERARFFLEVKEAEEARR